MATRCGVSEAACSAQFANDHECVLAAFETGLERLCEIVNKATAVSGGDWLNRARAGVVAFLGFLDDEPAWGRFLICDLPVENGPLRVECAARVLGVLTSLLDDASPTVIGEFSPEPQITSELVIGGAVSVVGTHIREGETGSLVELAPQLMSFIVQPYLGQEVARCELRGLSVDQERVEHGTPVRSTYRTARVLRAIGEAPRSSNREVAAAAGLKDEGQTSKLLRRLEAKGLVENVGLGHVFGEPNAWVLTGTGRDVADLNAHELRAPSSARRGAHRSARGTA